MRRSIVASLTLLLLIILSLSNCRPNTRVLVKPTTTPISAAPTITSPPPPSQISIATPAVPAAALTIADIFANISPSLAFIETPVRIGSGVLIEDGYVVTNAHVVWPFSEARLVFPDGTEYPNAPVLNWDLLADLALIGPIQTSISPLTLVDREDLAIGSEVFLIGYPGEAEKFPQPAITRGLLSRRREWQPIQMTYFQTDALIAGGQSGGALVSERGEVIGMSGLSFTEAGFGLAASAADLLPRIQGLSAGEDVAGLGQRRLPVTGGQLVHNIRLRHQWDSRLYIIDEPVGTAVDLKIAGEKAPALALFDIFGQALIFTNKGLPGLEAGSAVTEVAAPHFVILGQAAEGPGSFQVRSNRRLIPYHDIDDGRRLTAGQTHQASIDCPGDIDYFALDLAKGEAVNITVEAAQIDPFLIIDDPQAPASAILSDNDSGGGLFGQNAELTYHPPHSGAYFIIVSDANRKHVGGYILTVTAVSSQAMPAALIQKATPNPTPSPSPTPITPMALYESESYPFTIQYPAHWPAQPRPNGFSAASVEDKAALDISAEELAAKVGSMTLESYVDAFLLWGPQLNENFELLSRRRAFNAQGLPIQVIVFTSGPDGLLESSRLIYLHQGQVAFNLTYSYLKTNYQALQPIVDFSFNTFQIIE